MSMKNKFTFTLLAFTLFLCISSHAQQECKTTQLVNGLKTGYPVCEAMVFPSQELGKKNKSSLYFEIHSKQQLGSERHCEERLQIDGLDKTEITAVGLDLSANMTVLERSFLLKNTEYVFKVLDREIGKSLTYGGEKYWLSPILYC